METNSGLKVKLISNQRGFNFSYSKGLVESVKLLQRDMDEGKVIGRNGGFFKS